MINSIDCLNVQAKNYNFYVEFKTYLAQDFDFISSVVASSLMITFGNKTKENKTNKSN